MAIRETLCTSLDVRNLSEFITTQVRDNARIVQFMHREDPVILSALKATYSGGASDLENEDGPWNGPVQIPYPTTNETTGVLVDNSGSGALRDITPATTATTELWTLTFSDATNYSISGSSSGAQTAGATDADYDNGEIAIASADWSGAPAENDQFLVAIYKYDPLVVAIAAKMAAALTVMSVYQGVSEEMAAQARRLRREADAIIKALQTPFNDNGMRLGTFASRDVSPEGSAYKISQYGSDLSEYTDNARTSWDDSSAGGSMEFLCGCCW